MTQEDAHNIVTAARKRGLGSQPRWRRTGAVLWSAFLGACCALAAVLLAPDYWSSSPFTLDRLTVIFVVAWTVSLIPAVSASLLASPPESPTDDDAR